MKLICVYVPRDKGSDGIGDAAQAMYETKIALSSSGMFRHQLEDISQSIWDPFSLEFFSHSKILYLCMAGGETIIDHLINGVYAWMTGCEIQEIEDYTRDVNENTEVVGCELKLLLPDIYPYRVGSEILVDSLSPVVNAMSETPDGVRMVTQTIVRPLKDTPLLHLKLLLARFCERILMPWRIRRLLRKSLPSNSLEMIKTKCNSPLFLVSIRIAALCDAPENASETQRTEVKTLLTQLVSNVAEATKQFSTEDENRFVVGKIESGAAFLQKVQQRRFGPRFRLSARELTSFFHPAGLGDIPNAAHVTSRKAPAPIELPTDTNSPNVTIFAHTNFRDITVPFGIRRADRQRHTYILGKSGCGKSSLIQLLVKGDIDHGRGCAVLDPHGDLIDDIFRLIPKHRANDVILLDPTDASFTPGFNPLQPIRPQLKTRLVFAFLDSCQRVFANDWSQRMEHLFRFAILAIADLPNAHLLTLRRVLTDEPFRTDVVRRASDESVKRFWLSDYIARRSDYESSALVRVLNSLDEILANETVRKLFTQTRNILDFRAMMDTRKIVLLKVSKSALGEKNAQLLGSLLIWKIYEAAMSRVDIPPEVRQDFGLYIDELQYFATPSFEEIVSESRKYRLALTFAHQHLSQIPPKIRAAIFGNVSSFLTFRVGGDDAGALARELSPRFSKEDVLNLPLREFYIKMSIDGEAQEAFSGRTIDVAYLPENEHCTLKMIRQARPSEDDSAPSATRTPEVQTA